MSALAQYVNGIGKQVSGSDRFFKPGEFNETQERLETEGIQCYLQDGSGLTDKTDLVVASTAIEDSVPDMQKAKQLNIPVIRRSELLSLICDSKKTIAIGGTSGKSTTSAMLFQILQFAGLQPGIISGAGLVSLIRQGKIGNAEVGDGDWLVIEADESDGSIVQYKPEFGVLLNIEKDHKDLNELTRIFNLFKTNCRNFIVNRAHPVARELSARQEFDFSSDPGNPAGTMASGFQQKGLEIEFKINDISFRLQTVGLHNMENALAAVAVALKLGVNLETCAGALMNYEGIYRRHQVYGQKKGVWLVDDYAHNPAKCAASINACQDLAPKVIAWLQPHGYAPTQFLRDEFVSEISRILRKEDEIWMSEIFYAGGTATKSISSNDLVRDIKEKGCNAFFIENRNDFLDAVRTHLTENCVLLLMGARDPSLEDFAKKTWEEL